MPIIKSEEDERKALLHASRLMLVSARTAPKSGGVDDILTMIVVGKVEVWLTLEGYSCPLWC